MNKAVWKYKLTDIEFKKEMTISMPMDARILYFDFDKQEGQFAIWAECIPQCKRQDMMEDRTFIFVPTGMEMGIKDPEPDVYWDDKFKYIGTCTTQQILFWHLYEVLK